MLPVAVIALVAALTRTPQGAPPDAGDFSVLLWRGSRSDAAGEALARALGGTVVIGDGAAPAGLDFLVFNAAGRGPLHLDGDAPEFVRRRARWVETRDPALLVRQPCLTDPATREALFATLRHNLAAREGAHGLGVSLGDEVSVTPGGSPWDACLSPTCRAAWRSFLAARPELDDAARHRYADPASGSTDAARAALTDGRTEELEPWFLRREFHQQVICELLEELARAARREYAGVPVGLLGCSGRTAFGGVDVERLLGDLDFVECYPVSDARERMFTARGPGVRALQTVFPDANAPDRAAWRTFEHWLRGGEGIVVWSDRELLASEVARARLQRAVDDVRAIGDRVGRFAPAPAGVALVESAPAVALGWLEEALLDGPTWPQRLQGRQEAQGERERSLRCWLRLLEDLGMLPGALSIEAVGAPTAERFPVLVLHRLAVLDAVDLGRLEAYLDAGGTLVVDGRLGWIDSRGRRRADPLIEALARRAPERVHSAPDLVAGYERERLAAPAAARAAREAWWPVLARAGVERAPFEVEGESSPWLRAWIPGAPAGAPRGALLCAALPNAPGAALRAGVPRVVPRSPEVGVQWIHPAAVDADGRRVLAAGDAAVFLLVPDPAPTAAQRPGSGGD